VTLDREENKVRALHQPSLFIQNLEDKEVQTICIDEVQKAAVLFDTLKAEVDEKKRPGRFAISGSTEFSRKTGIRDALTGRIALLRLFPLNVAEIEGFESRFPLTREKKAAAPKFLSLKVVNRWLDRGGMPGIFAVREAGGREALFDGWIETTCSRDLAQFNIPRFNPELARRILFELVRVETPNRTEIARALGVMPRKIEAHLQAFKALFVLYEIEPYKTSVGKSLFYLFDAGLAAFLKADERYCLKILFLNECLSQFSCAGESRPDVFCYMTQRGSRLDFVVQTKTTTYAVLLTHEEAPTTYTLRAAEAFAAKHPNIEVRVYAPCLEPQKYSPRISISSWTAMV